MNYAEYLKSLGANEEEIKILDTSTARKAYEAQMKAANDAKALADRHKAEADAYQKWYEEQGLPYAQEMERRAKVAEAAAAAERARIESLQGAGIIAPQEPAKPAAPAAEPPAFDPSKYVPVEKFNELAVRAADSIATVADLTAEHAALGLPPVSWRQMKTEAQAAKLDLESYWKQKFSVDAKRAEKANADKAAYEKKIADEAVAKYRSEQANPMTTTALPSRTPFTGKVPSASDTEMPWNKSDSQRVNERLSRLQQKHPDLLN